MIDGYYTKNLLADSPDGLIEYTHDDNNDNCCHDDLQFGEHEKITVEIKCPFPDQFKVIMHYKLPRYYVMQVLMHMKATSSEQNIYGCVGTNSVTFIECQYSQGLCNDLWDRLCYYYDKVHPTQPKKVTELPQEFNGLLDHCIETHTSLIWELPIIHGKEGLISVPNKFNPYNIIVDKNVQSSDSSNFQKELFHEVCQSAIQCIKDAHHINHEEATELLAFVGTDSQRIPIPGIPCHLPIAYALKGNSL